MAKKAKHGFFFKDWIQFYGRTRLADELGVVKATVDKWAQGAGTPQSQHMKAIKKISGGHVDYVHILDGIEIEVGGLQEPVAQSEAQ